MDPSISQRYGSADPDPHQNFMDLQHCYFLNFFMKNGIPGNCSFIWFSNPLPYVLQVLLSSQYVIHNSVEIKLPSS